MRDEIQNSIRDVLFNNWDPLGVNDLAPHDEYDSYISGIYQLLIANATEIEIAEYLRQTEITKMEMVTDSEHRSRVAALLKRLDIS